MVEEERRDVVSRATAVQAVVDALVASPPVADFSRAGLVRSVADRICKRLAVRGLVKITPSGWSPAPPLVCPAPLVESSVEF